MSEAMNGTSEMLNMIYQNAQMGEETLDKMLEYAKEGELKKLMVNQRRGYEDVRKEAKKLLDDRGSEVKGLSGLSKWRTDLMIEMQTLSDRSEGHLAEMMLIGSNMGVIDALKNLRRYNGEADRSIQGLMKKALEFEEDNAEKMKKYIQ